MMNVAVPQKIGTTTVLVTGSRDWPMYEIVFSVIGNAAMEIGTPITLIHGGANGVDSMAARVWSDLALGPVHMVPPNWAAYGNAAGIIRNKEMVEMDPSLCLAFIYNDSRGATHCAQYAKDYGVPTYIYPLKSSKRCKQILEIPGLGKVRCELAPGHEVDHWYNVGLL